MAPENYIAAPAGFWRRVGAKFFDFALLFGFQLVLLALVAILDAFIPQSAAVILSTFLLGLVAQVLYFGIGNSDGRRTFGYRVAKLRLENLQGQSVSLGRGLWRSLLSNGAQTLIAYGGFLNFLPTLFGAKKRAGHDFVCGTQVVGTGETRHGALWAAPLLLLLIFGLWGTDIIFPSALRAFYIPSGAMENTLRVDDRLLVNLLTYQIRAPRNGEIAVFKAPRIALRNFKGETDIDFIKRVVGTPGDVVTIVNRQLFRNGAPVGEPFANWNTENSASEAGLPAYSYDLKIVGGAVYSREFLERSEPGLWTKNGSAPGQPEQRRINAAKPEAVPQNQFLMLGDHRANSNDSHVWGFVPRGAFVGRAINTFSPSWKTLH